MDDVAQRLGSAEFPYRLRPHQLAAVRAAQRAEDPSRCHLVLPPGSGKTLIGAELARRAGNRTLVLAPNTAIAGQWVLLWRLLGRDTISIGEDRSLSSDVTVLTYQALATFASDADELADLDRGAELDPEDPDSHTARLTPQAAALVARIRAEPQLTLILDEAHHLAETWGELLDEVLDDSDDHLVIALTATPRSRLNAEQRELTDRLFGPVLFTVSTPALVRDEVLAPFRELVRFVQPTAAESGYLESQATRWQELLTSLRDPEFSAPSFDEHIRSRWLDRSGQDGHDAPSWSQVSKRHPQIARAILRLVHVDLLPLPEGARLGEADRQAPAVEDWVALIEDYGTTVLLEREPQQWEQLRAALRSVGWTLTSRGARRGRSSVDRVLAKSAAKSDAAVTVLREELAVRGNRLRAAVVTDHEQAAAMPSADLRSVLADDAGSAWEALASIQTALPELRPVLMTGRSVAGARTTMTELVHHISNGNPQLGAALSVEEADVRGVPLSRLSGPGWHPRVWISAITGWFLAGGTNVLVGTRGLLGEGWDAASLNVLIDLTTATTPTAVVQTRGRALRRDPGDPAKGAHIWSIVAVSDTHPRGDLDYRRFVTKHEGFHSIDTGGRIVSGVAHVDPECGPYQPPSAAIREQVNARMLAGVGDVHTLAEAWGVGQPYLDIDTDVVQVLGRSQRLTGLDAPAVVAEPYEKVRGLVPTVGAGVGLVLPIIAGAPPIQGFGFAALGAVLGWGVDAGARRLARNRELSRLAEDDTLLAIGRAVAAAYNLDPDHVSVTPDEDNVWRVSYLNPDGPRADESAAVSAAVTQILTPVDWPRYLVSRRLPRQRAEVWHAVPDDLGRNRDSADRFLRCWQEHVSPGRVVYTGNPEGAGLLTAARGLNPGDVTAAIRSEWN
ncbi:MAG: DEAD/DEAH box helicase family protein [Actinobacteria bacterium]|nr:DEAD/DEAH box helicase family protein [Actinomycetota bacterium]